MTNEVLNLLEQAEGVLHGHFCLTSGLHSDIYFQCAKLYQYPEITSELGKLLAEKLSDIEFDTIVAPAIGAVIIGYETARTIKETMEAIKEFEPEVVAVGCIVDRTKGKTDYNIKSLLQIDPVVYDPSDCPLCKEGIELVKPGSRAEEKAKA